ncbi:WD40 repeat domain-containing protein, partial [Nonomuraea mesophila]|uniref:WD40 repeat domain-containing protein n=1 Tax=Nonomuraea mesophila TaxID=2530382 RepID=UPI001C704B3E
PSTTAKPRPSGGSPPAAGDPPVAGPARPSAGALSGGGGPRPAGRPIEQPVKGPGPAVAALPGVNGAPSVKSSGEDAGPSPENGAETFRVEERQAPTETGTLTLGTVEGTLDGPPVFSPDGRLLALPGAGEVRVWNVAERRVTGSYPLRDPGHGLAFSGDGRTLRYLSGTGSVVSLDVAGLPAPSDTGRTATFSGNGRFAAKEVGDTIELTDTVAGRTLGRIAAAGDVSFDAGGRLLAVTGDPVTVWEVAGARRVASIDAGGAVLAVALSPDGATLATARGSALETWDVREGRRIKVYEGAADAALAFSPDGSTLAAGANLLDLRTGKITPLALAVPANVRTTPTALAFSPDGRTLAFGLDGGRVLLWDVYERVPRGTLGTGTTPVDELRFSPKGDLLAIDAARTSLWDVNTLREVGEVGSWAAGPVFSQDGKRLRGVTLDGTVRERPVDPALTAQEVCVRAGGPLSKAEWSRLIPESGYRDIC